MEWPVTRLVGQDKALWKKEMRAIISQNGILIRPLGQWIITGHIQQTALLAQETGILYAKEATIWICYTYQMETISTRFGLTYRQHKRVEHLPEWKVLASIEQTGKDHVRYQGAVGTITSDNRTPQRLEDILKEWGETWIREKIEGILIKRRWCNNY